MRPRHRPGNRSFWMCTYLPNEVADGAEVSNAFSRVWLQKAGPKNAAKGGATSSSTFFLYFVLCNAWMDGCQSGHLTDVGVHRFALASHSVFVWLHVPFPTRQYILWYLFILRRGFVTRVSCTVYGVIFGQATTLTHSHTPLPFGFPLVLIDQTEGTKGSCLP